MPTAGIHQIEVGEAVPHKGLRPSINNPWHQCELQQLKRCTQHIELGLEVWADALQCCGEDDQLAALGNPVPSGVGGEYTD